MLHPNSNNYNKKTEESNDTYGGTTCVVVGSTLGETSGTVEQRCEAIYLYTACGRRKNRNLASTKSVFSIGSVLSVFTVAAVLACNSCGSVLSCNTLLSIASLNSVASIGSVNSFLSIGSLNCAGCVFNRPFLWGKDQNMCKKIELDDDDDHDDDDRDNYYGRTYKSFMINSTSEEDLVNDCCLFIQSSDAQKQGLQGFILNANHNECLVFKEDKKGAPTLSRGDVDAATYVYVYPTP